jgi:5-methylthioadenosine/S-adenosylhomocysteine deaminase
MSTQKNRRTLFKGGTVLTLDPKVPNLPIGDVLVDGDRITALGANLQVDDVQVIDAADSIVVPGLIDAHHHMWLSVMRRMMPDVDDLFAYIDVVAETLGAHYRPLDMYISTKLTAIASLDAGITTIIDACHSSRSPEAHRRGARCSRRRGPSRAAHGRRSDGQEGVGRAPAR